MHKTAVSSTSNAALNKNQPIKNPQRPAAPSKKFRDKQTSLTNIMNGSSTNQTQPEKQVFNKKIDAAIILPETPAPATPEKNLKIANELFNLLYNELDAAFLKTHNPTKRTPFPLLKEKDLTGIENILQQLLEQNLAPMKDFLVRVADLDMKDNFSLCKPLWQQTASRLNLNRTNHEGHTALHIAIINGNIPILKLLLDLKAHHIIKGTYRSPLSFACRKLDDLINKLELTYEKRFKTGHDQTTKANLTEELATEFAAEFVVEKNNLHYQPYKKIRNSIAQLLAHDCNRHEVFTLKSTGRKITLFEYYMASGNYEIFKLLFNKQIQEPDFGVMGNNLVDFLAEELLRGMAPPSLLLAYQNMLTMYQLHGIDPSPHLAQSRPPLS
ncbi:ankyrin repeat domain-containing protein [Paraburkholderia hayleyella]|uniref:ankyrin repeat domain-containing protein n=1 Tax=Paraburkholderia hayleyella TaxID=2152889 RepID=UPI001C655EFE|nr:ankyrin repeat domain-containing protein [Paraburkholderia hayleyella]